VEKEPTWRCFYVSETILRKIGQKRYATIYLNEAQQHTCKWCSGGSKTRRAMYLRVGRLDRRYWPIFGMRPGLLGRRSGEQGGRKTSRVLLARQQPRGVPGPRCRSLGTLSRSGAAAGFLAGRGGPAGGDPRGTGRGRRGDPPPHTRFLGGPVADGSPSRCDHRLRLPTRRIPRGQKNIMAM